MQTSHGTFHQIVRIPLLICELLCLWSVCLSFVCKTFNTKLLLLSKNVSDLVKLSRQEKPIAFEQIDILQVLFSSHINRIISAYKIMFENLHHINLTHFSSTTEVIYVHK